MDRSIHAQKYTYVCIHIYMYTHYIHVDTYIHTPDKYLGVGRYQGPLTFSLGFEVCTLNSWGMTGIQGSSRLYGAVSGFVVPHPTSEAVGMRIL